MNIAEALANEIKRNFELLEEYKKIPTGTFGATMISQDIDNAVDALASGDVIEMLKAYEVMKGNK